MSKSHLLQFVAAISLAVLCQSDLYAQSPLGSILGTVHDPTGAMIPDTNVVLVDENRGYTRSTTSNVSGDYRFEQVMEGTYTLTVENAGFKKYEQRGVILLARQVLRLDAALQLGEVTETVTVTGEAPVVNSDSVTISGGFQEKLLREFHTPTANAYSPHLLALMLIPGSVHMGNAQFKLGGSRGNMYESKLDGADSNHNQGAPSVQSVKEMNVVYVNANAEYRSPATVDAIMQTGTNNFHAGAKFEVENAALNAAGVAAIKRPPGLPNYYGEYFGGGPVIIPGLYNGKNRTHFFGTYERGKKSSYFRSGFLDVPSLAFRQGDFSSLAKQLTNPFTGQPLTGNQMPQSLMYPGTLFLQNKYWPKPNTGAPNALALNFADTRSAYSFIQRLYLRGDHQVTQHNHLSFAYTHWWDDNVKGSGVWTGGLVAKVPDGGANIQNRRNQNFILVDTHIFSPTLTNEFRLSMQYYEDPGYYSVKGREILDGAGIKGIKFDYPGTPRIDITGFSGMWGGAGGGHYTAAENFNTRYQLVDNVSFIRRNHTFKLGADLRHFGGKLLTAGVWAGTYAFDGRFSGDPWADFLLGLPSSSSRFTPRDPVYQYDYSTGFYFQDDFKLSPRITLNYGLRYDRSTVPKDKTGAYFTFGPNTGNIVVPSQNALQLVNPAFPSTIKIVTASQVGYPENLLKGNSGRLSPRLGLVFRPFNNATTVIRAGYGHFALYQYGLNTGGPFALTETFVNRITNGVPLVTLSNPFPSVGAPPAQSSSGINPNLRDISFQQWNLSMEREIGFSTALRLSYIGSKSTHLPYTREINRLPAGTVPYSPLRNPYPAFQSVTYTENGGNATYHGLQLQATRRFTQGLSVDAGFTYHKELTDAHNDGGYFQDQTFGSSDPFNRSRDKGLASGLPMPFQVSLNSLYELPFGHGRQFLRNTSGIINHILGGWDVSGYLASYSGRWWTAAYSGRDISNTNNFSGRPDRICDGNLSSSQRTSTRWFDNACYSVPPAGTGRFGNAGVNTIQGPGAWFFNMGTYKHFPIRENLTFRLGMAVINLLNHPVWDQPRTNISGSNVGTLGIIPSLMNFPNQRIIKLEAKLVF